jgi:hypothetical protein
MFKNLASALILTERNAEDEENEPKVKGRIVTTVAKAKELLAKTAYKGEPIPNGNRFEPWIRAVSRYHSCRCWQT